jgi:hypothetical protein
LPYKPTGRPNGRPRNKPYVVEAIELILKADRLQAQADIHRATARALLAREIDERK